MVRQAGVNGIAENPKRTISPGGAVRGPSIEKCGFSEELGLGRGMRGSRAQLAVHGRGRCLLAPDISSARNVPHSRRMHLLLSTSIVHGGRAVWMASDYQTRKPKRRDARTEKRLRSRQSQGKVGCFFVCLYSACTGATSHSQDMFEATTGVPRVWETVPLGRVDFIRPVMVVCSATYARNRAGALWRTTRRVRRAGRRPAGAVGSARPTRAARSGGIHSTNGVAGDAAADAP